MTRLRYQQFIVTLDRPTAEQIGGTPVKSYEYDNGLAGDGNLTKLTLIPGGTEADRVTRTHYDWRNRPVLVEEGYGRTDPAPLHKVVYDNLGQVAENWVYDASTFDSLNADFVPPADTLRAKTTHEIDDRGRVFQTFQHEVDQSSGALGGSLRTDVFYDGRGNAVKTVAPGGLVTRQWFDEAGRMSGKRGHH